MRYNFINVIKGKVFGVWKVKIKFFDIEYEFVIKDLKSYSLFKESKIISGVFDEIVWNIIIIWKVKNWLFKKYMVKVKRKNRGCLF